MASRTPRRSQPSVGPCRCRQRRTCGSPGKRCASAGDKGGSRSHVPPAAGTASPLAGRAAGRSPRRAGEPPPSPAAPRSRRPPHPVSGSAVLGTGPPGLGGPRERSFQGRYRGQCGRRRRPAQAGRRPAGDGPPRSASRTRTPVASKVDTRSRGITILPSGSDALSGVGHPAEATAHLLTTTTPDRFYEAHPRAGSGGRRLWPRSVVVRPVT